MQSSWDFCEINEQKFLLKRILKLSTAKLNYFRGEKKSVMFFIQLIFNFFFLLSKCWTQLNNSIAMILISFSYKCIPDCKSIDAISIIGTQ